MSPKWCVKPAPGVPRSRMVQQEALGALDQQRLRGIGLHVVAFCRRADKLGGGDRPLHRFCVHYLVIVHLAVLDIREHRGPGVFDDLFHFFDVGFHHRNANLLHAFQ